MYPLPDGRLHSGVCEQTTDCALWDASKGAAGLLYDYRIRFIGELGLEGGDLGLRIALLSWVEA
jgi:hypothetical protein